jgi:hypothetical protein
MSLKENVNFIKSEITSQEKFFESFFKLEKFWKKYKVAIISSIVIIIIGFVSININQYIQTQNKIKANKAFNILLDNPKNTDAKNTLNKLNPQLLMIAKYLTNAQNNKIDIEFLDTIVKFNQAISINDIKTIDALMLNQKFLLKEYALFQKALIQTINKDYIGAKETLALIPTNSDVAKLSTKLKHYLLTK